MLFEFEKDVIMGDNEWSDIVTDIVGYTQVPSNALLRMASRGNSGAQYEIDRRTSEPVQGLMPRIWSFDGSMLWGDAVVNDVPYTMMPTQLLKNLRNNGDIGAAEELLRRA